MGVKVTSFDVAKLAGVSQPTVSRALRNMPGTSPETRQRVLEAARSLSYVPSDTGRALSTRNTRRVAVVSDALTNPYYPELVEPLRRRLADRGYRAVLLGDTDASSDRDTAVDALADGSYDGVVLTTTVRRSTLPRDLTERGLPHVLVNRVLDHPESPSCTVDNRGGAEQVADLVAGLGHRRVATIQGPISTSTGRERSEALIARLRSHGIAVPRRLQRRSEFSHDAGHAAAVDLLSESERPTAVVCGNDVLALGALSATRALGLSVPEDVSVIGFDDIPMAGWPLVALTTVRCDLDALAGHAVDLLVDAMAAHPMDIVVRRISVDLILRGTHGPAPT